MTDTEKKAGEAEIIVPLGFAEKQAPLQMNPEEMSKPFKAALEAVEKMGKKEKTE